MAIKWMTWAFDQDCSPTEKLVLLAIADCANADGEAYPSQSEISEKTSLHKSSIVRALQFLQEKKLLSKIHRTKKNGGRTSDLYRLHSATVEQSEIRTVSGGGKVAQRGEGGSTVSGGVVAQCDLYIDEPSLLTVNEPSLIADHTFTPEDFCSQENKINPPAKQKKIKSLDELETHPLNQDYEKTFLEKYPSVDRFGLREEMILYCRANNRKYADYWAALCQWARKRHMENKQRGSPVKSAGELREEEENRKLMGMKNVNAS